MALAAGQIARAADVMPNIGGINNACGSGTTTSPSFANLPATSSFAFTKRQSSTRLKVEMHMTAFVTGAQSSVDIGVQVGGVDYMVAKLNFNTLSAHLQISGVHPNVAPGLAAGDYTIQGRWRRSGGTGTANVDGADWLSIVVTEVP